jgi:lysophospholipase L1-like esterase
MNIRRQSSIARFSTVATAAVALYLLAAQPAAQTPRTNDHWVGTWATAVVSRAPVPPQRGAGPQGTPPAPATPAPQAQAPQGPAPAGVNAPPAQGRGGAAAPPLNFNNQTIREVVHTSIGGERVRVVFTNAYGTAPLSIGAAHIAIRDTDASIVAKTDRALTFNGSQTTVIPPGAIVVSDAAMLAVPPTADLAIDLFLPGNTAEGTSPLTIHGLALQTSYVSPTGNHAGEPELTVQTKTMNWFFLSRVEVLAPADARGLVAIGDSITDGNRSTPDTNGRWPDTLAKRLNAAAGPKVAIMNVGIAGNAILSDRAGQGALARFDRDVLSQPGATHVIMMEGVNDIRPMGSTVTSGDLIAGFKQVIERAHAHGLKVIGATMTPFEGMGTGWTPDNEMTRKAVNDWIKTSKAFDGVVDFDAAVRDPNHPAQLNPELSSDDHIHPNDAGYVVMGKVVDLALLKPAPIRKTQ